jgi:hypothetical protein
MLIGVERLGELAVGSTPNSEKVPLLYVTVAAILPLGSSTTWFARSPWRSLVDERELARVSIDRKRADVIPGVPSSQFAAYRNRRSDDPTRARD